MNQILRKYKKIWDDIFKNNITFFIILGVVCFLSYGFTITHHSIGMDNTNLAQQIYLDDYGTVFQGRWALVILNKLFGIYNYSPFWVNGVAIIILYIATMFWSLLFKSVGKDKITKANLMVFSTLLVSYPLINEIFIYVPVSVPLCLGLTAISIILTYEFYKQKQIKNCLWPIAIMAFTLSIYEAFASVFLCAIFFILLLEYINDKELVNFKYSIKTIAWFVVVLFLSILLRAVLSEIAIKIASIGLAPEIIDQRSSDASNNIIWFSKPFVETLIVLIKGIGWEYVLASYWYFPMTIFMIAILIAGVLALSIAIKNKDSLIILLMLGLGLSVFSLIFIQGAVTYYRTCNTFGIFIAFILMLLMIILKKHWQKALYGFAMFVLVINQTQILNDWFVNDYLRYEKDKEIAINVAETIEEEFDVSKPVVFIGEPKNSSNVKIVEHNGATTIGWGIYAFTGTYGSGNQLHDFMKMHGHVLVQASQAQYKEAKKGSSAMPAYPKKGYIKDCGNYIVVNFGEGSSSRDGMMESEIRIREWLD